MKKAKTVKWLKRPQTDNYPEAQAYLDLLYAEELASELVSKLKRASVKEFKAKDIFRASDLGLIGKSNPHVALNHKKIKKGEALAPVLLVRDPLKGKVVVANGFHRMCAAYRANVNSMIPCKIV